MDFAWDAQGRFACALLQRPGWGVAVLAFDSGNGVEWRQVVGAQAQRVKCDAHFGFCHTKQWHPHDAIEGFQLSLTWRHARCVVPTSGWGVNAASQMTSEALVSNFRTVGGSMFLGSSGMTSLNLSRTS